MQTFSGIIILITQRYAISTSTSQSAHSARTARLISIGAATHNVTYAIITMLKVKMPNTPPNFPSETMA